MDIDVFGGVVQAFLEAINFLIWFLPFFVKLLIFILTPIVSLGVLGFLAMTRGWDHTSDTLADKWVERGMESHWFALQNNGVAKRYFEKQYLPKDAMPPHEKHLLSTTLRTILGKIDGDVARAILGYHTPGWTPKEADENDLLVIIDAHKMINTPAAQHYLLTQNFSLVMHWINKREVDNPNNKLAEIVFDETVSILDIPGFAETLGRVSPLYRSRKVSLTVIIQALWQLDEKLAEQIWNLANIVCFTVSNVDDAEIIAHQLFKYDPKFVKHAPKTEYQNATTEPEGGQDRITADWLQNLKAREFIARRYLTEQKKEEGVQYVTKTDDMPTSPSYVEPSELKRYFLTEQRKPNGMPRNVTIREALDVIKQREKLLDLDQSDPNF